MFSFLTGIRSRHLNSRQFSLGCCFNSLIYSGGTISGSYDNTGSGLNLSQQFNSTLSIVNSITGYPNLTSFKAGRQDASGNREWNYNLFFRDGTLVTRIALTSSVNFTSGTTPDITFCPSTAINPLYRNEGFAVPGNHQYSSGCISWIKCNRLWKPCAQSPCSCTV